jgi:phenol hydroxylase P1 protein
MTIEIKTAKLDSVRNTFGHIKRRFGDKPATRYQEATYDIAAQTNFHYKPLWDQDHELNDPSKTAVVMADWYALKDPRQFYYGTYVQNRAKMQENAENNYGFFEKRNLANKLPENIRETIIKHMIPLRHVEQAANLNNMFCTSNANYCTAVAQATLFEAMDRFGAAQYFSRIGLLLDNNTGDTLSEAKQEWMNNPSWQGLRAYCEKTLTIKDWFETFIAQDIVLDSLINNLYYTQMDAWLNDNGGADISMLTEFMSERAKDSSRWSDFMLKTVCAESEENKNQVKSWISTWRIHAQSALEPLASAMLGDNALAEAFASLEARLKKIGIAD